MKTALHFFAGLFALSLMAAATNAGVTNAVFNFEGQPLTGNGGLTSLSQTNQGLTISIDRGGQPFDIDTLASLSGTSTFGARTLAPTPPGGNPFNVNFSQPVTHFSAAFGDFGVNTTDALAITAFSGPNGTGTNLGAVTGNLPLNSVGTMALKTLAVDATGIGSVQLSGGTVGDTNSVFYDNFQATTSAGGTAIPLPAAVYVMPLGAAVAWFAARKRVLA